MTLLLAAAMLGYAVSLHRRWGWPLETLPFALTAASIAVLYGAGLAGILSLGVWGIIAGGLILGLLEFTRGGWKRPAIHTVPPGILMYALLLIAVTLRLQGAAFHGWDEFSHWGLTSKIVIQNHGLVTSDSPVLFKDYPPGSALFHYLLSAGTSFSETRIYVAHAVLALSALAALFVGSGWVGIIATVLFGYFSLYTFSHGLQSLDVDHIVGLFFGCGLGSYFLSRDPDRLTRLIPVAFALPLLKSVGLLLAIFMVGAAITDRLLSGHPSRRQMIVMLLLVLAPITASQTWSRHVKSLNAAPTFPMKISVSGIRDSFSAARSSDRDRATIDAYRAALTSTVVSPRRNNGPFEAVLRAVGLGHWNGTGLSARTWAILFGLFALAIVAVQPDRSSVQRGLSWIAWLALCGVCYAFGLLVLYLYSFAEYEGVRLASFGRYFGIFFLAAGLTVFTWALEATSRGARRSAVSQFMVAGLVLLMVYSAPNAALRFIWVGPSGLTEVRSQVRTALQPAVTRTQTTDRVFTIWQGSTGFEFYVGRYELAPRVTNTGCWSVGTPRFEGDVWTCPKSPEQLRRMLENFDVLVLGRVDEKFWAEFGELFPTGGRGRVFRVAKATGPHQIQLVPSE